MLKLLSPIQLCFCLLLFFLPWIEIQCTPKPGAKPDPMTGGMPTGPQPLVAQSGLQIATGGYTFSNPMLADRGKGRPTADGKADEGGPGAAPLLLLFPVAVLLGIVFGFLPMGGVSRKLAVFSCCAVAFGSIGVQAAIGFPLKKSFDEDQAKAPQGGGGGEMMMADDSMTIELVWKIPLYATLVFLIGATGTSFLGGAGKPAREPRRRYADEDESDDDDRPRRRRPAGDADDDDDDRPRRRRGA